MEILVFSHEKAPLFKTLLVLGQKKGAFSISDVTKALKLKGAFFLNWASALYQCVKGAFFSESMDFQLSLEKKIKCVGVLDNFLQKFKDAHKIDFFADFSKIWKNNKTFNFLFIFMTS